MEGQTPGPAPGMPEQEEPEEEYQAKGRSGVWCRWLLAVGLAAGVLVGACSPKGGKAPTASPAPVVTPSPSPSPVAKPSPSPAGTASPATPTQGSDQEVRDYLARVFPPGPGRDDVFLKCTVCHGIQVVILAGLLKDRSAWEMTRYRHDTGGLQGAQLSGRQAEHDPMWEYLIQHFGPDKPPPPPPPQRLLAGWQSYI